MNDVASGKSPSSLAFVVRHLVGGQEGFQIKVILANGVWAHELQTPQYALDIKINKVSANLRLVGFRVRSTSDCRTSQLASAASLCRR